MEIISLIFNPDDSPVIYAFMNSVHYIIQTVGYIKKQYMILLFVFIIFLNFLFYPILFPFVAIKDFINYFKKDKK